VPCSIILDSLDISFNEDLKVCCILGYFHLGTSPFHYPTLRLDSIDTYHEKWLEIAFKVIKWSLLFGVIYYVHKEYKDCIC